MIYKKPVKLYNISVSLRFLKGSRDGS